MSQLRQVTADYLREHMADFLPFLTHQDTGDLLTETQYEQYCTDVADTHTWGGQPEVTDAVGIPCKSLPLTDLRIAIDIAG